MSEVRVCFVCLGNICRSPTAEGVMRALLEAEGMAGRVHVDSAGTAGYHVGKPADARSRRAAERRGIALTSRARRFDTRDFGRFDHVLAMDRSNLLELEARAPDAQARARVALFRSFDPDAVARDDLEVPDPYYGGPDGFDRVLDLCEAACRGLLAHLRSLHDLDD